MHRYLLTTVLAMLLSMNAWSQEEERGAEPGVEGAADPVTEAADEASIEASSTEEEGEEEIDISRSEERR